MNSLTITSFNKHNMASDCGKSVVEYFGKGEGHECGYCKSKDTNFCYGMWGHMVNPSDYQDLIDRGWRRSGSYLYRPMLNVQCCPMYTIKCDAVNFKPSNSHKKVIKNFNRYINFDVRPKSSGMHTAADDEGRSDDDECDNSKKVDSSDLTASKVKLVPKQGEGEDINKPKCRKAKVIRAEKKKEKMMKRNEMGDNQTVTGRSKPTSSAKSLEQYLNDVVENPRHKLRVELVRSDSENKNQILDTSHSVYVKYQTAVHQSEPTEVSRRQFERFLVTSSLNKEESIKPGHPGFGSFHYRYWIDDKLVAVGVLDILPKCISSVYLFYDPDYSFLSLGTYAALKEIEFVRRLQAIDDGLSSYYMGFYIRSCPKMRYKGQFHPSFLLCPETFTWHPIEKCLPLLDSSKYCRFASSETVDREGASSNVDNVLVWCQGLRMRHADYIRHKPFSRKPSVKIDGNNPEKAKEYARLVGKTLSEKMFLVRV